MGEYQRNPAANVAVVGGGPAGLMAAIAAASAGSSVVLLEQLDQVGSKLLATGGGRCNLTNLLPPEDVMVRFGRYGRFMQPALAAMGPPQLREFFEALGVATYVAESGQVYPVTNSAITVKEALERRCRQAGVTILLRTTARRLVIEHGCVRGLETSAGLVAAKTVILACGGKSYPALGGTGGGYALAAQAGHDIIPPVPALVGLLTRETWPRQCAGAAVSNIVVELPGGKAASPAASAKTSGDLLFTHGGVSGPAVLDISGRVARLLLTQPCVPLRINLTPNLTRLGWVERLDQWADTDGAKLLRTMLARCLPAVVAEAILREAGIEGDARCAHLPRPRRQTVAQCLTALPLTVIGTDGFEKAMVTAGGVSLKQVDPRALRSKLAGGLLLAGETLDLDGPCGGFNLHWAFASGALAGKSAVTTPAP